MKLYNFLIRKGISVAFAVSGVIILISCIFIFSGLDAFNRVPTEQQAFAPEGEIFMGGIYLTYALLILAVVVTIVMSIFGLFKNPKSAKQALIAFIATLVVFIILYVLADPNGTGSLVKTIEINNISPGISKMITAGIQMTLILTIGAGVVTVICEGINFYKNR